MGLKYVKKSVIVEAMQWTGDEEAMREFLGQLFLIVGVDNKLRLETLEGPIWASIGDFVIKGIRGEYYPCKPDIFELSYDRV